MMMTRRTATTGLLAAAAATGITPGAFALGTVDLSPTRWPKGEYDSFMKAQGVDRTRAGAARGTQGAVTVACNGLAARAGLEALKQGGNAIDAVMTGALAQIALTMGAPVSYFGIMSLVYHEAKTGKTYTLNAEWNTVRGETDPMSIPGKIDFSSIEALQGMGPPSGRTALVGGFMKGVEAAHRRFGRLPFASLFDPAIYIAEQGMPVTPFLEGIFEFRDKDIRRLPETRATLVKPDGSAYRAGDLFRQPALAQTLRAVARDGADHMYGGPWGQRLVAAVQADGGKMTLDDLKAYDVIWADPLEAPLRNGYSVRTSPPPNFGGVSLIEAQNLAEAAGLCGGEHWTKSAASLKKAVDITQLFGISMFPKETQAAIYPGIDFSDASRVTKAHAEALWKQIESGKTFTKWKRTTPMHSDDIVAIDSEGNIAAITHSINCVNWGKTGLFVDGISIGDPASFQQAAIARVTPGERLPAPTETGIVFKDNVPVLGFASMSAGLHQRTFQCLLNYTCFGMDVEEAVNTPDFYLPSIDPATGETTLTVPEGRFDEKVLQETGLAWRVIPLDDARLGGEGKWVAISRDPRTGALHAASHNRNNSAAVAY
ncbi:gamma-glutamyltransferase [Sphingosinicella soli]|uniref:Gamma-glutamyltranspeptidase/glutathione hydrolase n=1 Tax=Sphingosinicella soli TaxID=333708 RepID=A0A7W7F8H0_9SPHN|nr:gamma-glutamyltransferase [Sphingosinicella soli]MBB4633709.1 gamma-glutamyltranspeptidase/glutathione hydrolase [Sphingosinicella soli]